MNIAARCVNRTKNATDLHNHCFELLSKSHPVMILQTHKKTETFSRMDIACSKFLKYTSDVKYSKSL